MHVMSKNACIKNYVKTALATNVHHLEMWYCV